VTIAILEIVSVGIPGAIPLTPEIKTTIEATHTAPKAYMPTRVAVRL
jgi:hypothetical protein